MTSSPVLAVALEGKNAVAVTRTLMGKTNCAEAAPGTIRGDFGASRGLNLVHGSDGAESAAREIELFFQPDELAGYELRNQPWLFNDEDTR